MISQAWPSSPRRSASATKRSSKNTSWMSPSPIREGIDFTWTPGAVMSASRMTMADLPEGPSEVCGTRASRKQRSARPA
ncbi:hypothetical protein D3C86_1819750 [compost metagenome]